MTPRLTSLFLLLLLVAPARTSAHGTKTEDDRRNPFLELGRRFEFGMTGDPLVDWNSHREWTAVDGRKLEAKLLGIENGTGSFLLSNGKIAPIALDRFSESDQRFAAEWSEMSHYFNLGWEEPKGVNGKKIEARIGAGAFAAEGKVHETPHFRFECDVPLNAATVKDFSQMFEATHLLVRSLPLGLKVAEPKEGRFVVRLFSEREDYEREGGLPASAGIYLLKTREILVPLESLGVNRVGNTYRKSADYDPGTLIHEITHALTHQWIDFFPMWVAEGLAEYMAAIPYQDGAFHPDEVAEGLPRTIAAIYKGSRSSFRPLKPEEFVYLDKDDFMLRRTPPEKVIELEPVEPFQIKLLKKGEETSSPLLVPAKRPPRVNPVIPPPVITINPQVLVVQRYSSSMLLIHHLMESGQVSGLRKYLYAQMRFEWDAEQYLLDYNRTLEAHQTAVKRQISDFDIELKKFNSAIDTYNQIVTRKNRGESIELPPVPKEPSVPDAIEVPEILAKPRAADRFSRSVLRKESAHEFLKLPASLGL